MLRLTFAAQEGQGWDGPAYFARQSMSNPVLGSGVARQSSEACPLLAAESNGLEADRVAGAAPGNTSRRSRQNDPLGGSA